MGHTETWDILPVTRDSLEGAEIAFLPIAGELSGPTQTVQNNFRLGPIHDRHAKAQEVIRFMQHCGSSVCDRMMRVNYFSAAGLGYAVKTTADVVNTEVFEAMSDGFEQDSSHSFGACLLDNLPSDDAMRLVRLLVERNFQVASAQT